MMHHTKIKLQTSNMFNIEARVDEVREIRDWLDELTDWQPGKYQIKISPSANLISVWFEEEKHAMMCTLRWA